MPKVCAAEVLENTQPFHFSKNNSLRTKLFSQTVGKCTPKWIRYSAKNKNRIRCVHPDCEAKKDLNFTYAGIMKHIIDIHTSQETAVRNFFPLSTVDYGN